jgi:BON domain
MSTTLLAPSIRALELLAESGQHELRRLSVTESDESVVLEGRVSRFYLKQLAQEAVRGIADGRRLINRIRVED